MTDEKKAEIKEKLKVHIAECGPQYGITPEILKEFKAQNKQPDDTNKCFFACLFKKIGLVSNKLRNNSVVCVNICIHTAGVGNTTQDLLF